MITLTEEHSHSAAYFGDTPDWLIVLAVNRDSDALARSNFRCAQKALETLAAVKEWTGEEHPVAVSRSSHWACGWVDYLIIDLKYAIHWRIIRFSMTKIFRRKSRRKQMRLGRIVFGPRNELSIFGNIGRNLNSGTSPISLAACGGNTSRDTLASFSLDNL